MKKLLLVAVVVFITMSAGAQFSSGTVQATGLTCALCSNAVNNALLKLPFIESVKPDIRNSSFALTFKQNSSVDIDAINDAVEEAGFSIGSLKLTGSFAGVSIANDTHVAIGNAQFHFVSVQPQTLNGERTITVVDKKFVTAKQFKKFSAATKMTCIQTGYMQSCCSKNGTQEGRIYHVTI